MKVIRILFIAIIFAALILPGIVMLTQTSAPESFSVSAVEDWIDEEIGFRSAFITAYGTICERLFHTSGNNQVLIGKDNMLFYSETINDYTGTSPMTDAEITALAESLASLSESVEARGAHLIVLIAPNKNTVYPENMPYYISRGNGSSNRERFHKQLNALSVCYIDALPLLQNAGFQTYYTTDTHWNPEGARLAYCAIMDQISQWYPDIAYNDYADAPRTENSHFGDLAKMYKPVTSSREVTSVVDVGSPYRFVRPMRSMDDMIIRTTSENNPQLNLFVLRDSFGEALFPYLASNAGSLTYSRTLPYDDALAQSEEANVIILEIVERNLGSLEIASQE
ncbi:MAG: hypothetical protein E7335_07280 [Clostridiales bacterium]|nr:hypothetical protein [Clostridiales bacterium]